MATPPLSNVELWRTFRNFQPISIKAVHMTVFLVTRWRKFATTKKHWLGAVKIYAAAVEALRKKERGVKTG
jgi:hypothetical protein